jgi:hypothetical protein
MKHTPGAVDGKIWGLETNGAGIAFYAITDNEAAVQSTPLTMSRNGDVNVGGSGGNVACKNQLNTFTLQQILSYASPQVTLHDTTQPVDARRFNLLNTGQYFYVQAVGDAGAFQRNCAQFGRNGDLNIQGAYRDLGRSTPMGYPIDYTPVISAGAGTATIASVHANSYSLVGKTMHLDLMFQVTLSALTNIVYMSFPPGIVNAKNHYGNAFIGAIAGSGQFEARAGEAQVLIYINQGSVNFGVGNWYLGLVANFFIQ